MAESAITFLLTLATVGAGLMAGVYFAFSGFIMQSLNQLGASQAADAMIAINKVILQSFFMIVFFGSTLLYLLIVGYALLDADLNGRWLLISAGMIYISGMFMITVLFNVPLNNRLAGVTENDEHKAEVWKYYLLYWTRWNHLRTSCSLITMLFSIQYLSA